MIFDFQVREISLLILTRDPLPPFFAPFVSEFDLVCLLLKSDLLIFLFSQFRQPSGGDADAHPSQPDHLGRRHRVRLPDHPQPPVVGAAERQHLGPLGHGVAAVCHRGGPRYERSHKDSVRAPSHNRHRQLYAHHRHPARLLYNRQKCVENAQQQRIKSRVIETKLHKKNKG